MWTESRLDAKSKRLFCCVELSGDRLHDSSSVGGHDALPGRIVGWWPGDRSVRRCEIKSLCRIEVHPMSPNQAARLRHTGRMDKIPLSMFPSFV